MDEAIQLDVDVLDKDVSKRRWWFVELVAKQLIEINIYSGLLSFQM